MRGISEFYLLHLPVGCAIILSNFNGIKPVL